MADEGVLGSFCSICKSKYTSPRQLDCFHVFCTPCLEKLIDGKSEILCPLCRELIICNENGIDMFKPYEYPVIQNNEGETEEITICQMCDDGGIYSVCKVCDQNMCRNCHEYHLKHKTFKTHNVERYEKPERKMAVKKVKSCDKHSKMYTIYCKSCNETLCEVCAKESHQTHKTLPVEHSAHSMRRALNVAISGLKSKLPYINSFINYSKTEKEKYTKHISVTFADMEIATTNLKDVFCKSVDMIFKQNAEYLKCESNEDKKKIEIFIEEFEREALSIQYLIKISEDTIKYANDSDMSKICCALNRKINSYENRKLSSLILNIPKFKPGNFVDRPVREFMGTVYRQVENQLHLKLNVPHNELSSYIFINKFIRIGTEAVNTEITNMCTDGTDNIYLFHVKYPMRQPPRVKVFVECRNLNNKLIWENVYGLNEAISSVVCMKLGKVFLSDGYFISINDVNHYKEVTVSANKINVDHQRSRGESVCIAQNGNIMIWNSDKHEVCELDETGNTVKTISISNELEWEESRPKYTFMSSELNHIFILTRSEIRCYDGNGDFKHRFCPQKPVDFKSMCIDRHGNVFVADAIENRICLFTWDGLYVKDVLLHSDGIDEPKSLAIDAVGNLWVLMNKKLSVYSYL